MNELVSRKKLCHQSKRHIDSVEYTRRMKIMFRLCRMQRVCTLSAFLTLIMLMVVQIGNIPVAHAATNQFRGVNWADPRDNYANDPVVPSGLSTSDNYATTYAKASAIIRGFAL